MTDASLTPGTRIGHFTAAGHLGAGGMGEVFRARDDRLDREVALKLLPRDTSADPAARARLLLEARSAASLNHPNVCTIFEVGEDGGREYIAMELVAGQTLAERRRAGPLAQPTLLRIGLEIADALDHAHRNGVIHRDLKPANVMLTGDGRVKVMDFGLARQVPLADAATRSAPEPSLTLVGAIVGTIHYLPPEVLQGARADARGDIWSLGVVLHEMVAGEPPFAGQTGYEVAAAILGLAPRPLPADVPPGLAVVIARCLEKEPARRYQDAGQVRAALEALSSQSGTADLPARPARPAGAAAGRTAPRPGWRIAVAGLGLLAVTAIVLLRGPIWGALVRSRSPEGTRSLAVLPLENLSQDPTQAYFADGMTEELSTRLAQISALRVVAQGSVTDLVRQRQPLSAIGRALRVPVLLRGSVMQVADRVRVTVQLVSASTGDLVWARSYERAMLDVLALQSELALAIAHEIQVKLTPQEQSRLASSRPIDPEAYQAYLRGRAVWASYTREGFEEAERLFRRALEIAPDYAPAWAGLADASYGLSSTYVPPAEALPKARAAAEKALALDESLPEAHTSLGIVKLTYDWDWAGALADFDRAIALRPGDPNAHLWRGRLLVLQGRFDEGLAAIRRALDLDPMSPWISANVAWHLYFARRHEEALAHLDEAIRGRPDYFVFHVFRGLVLGQMGRHEPAVEALEKAVAMDTNNDDLGQLAHAYGSAGRRKEAEATIARLLERRKTMFVPASNVAYAYAGLGELDEAFRWLDLALEDRSEMLIMLKVEPGFDTVRKDPRYQGILRRLRLAS